MVDLSSESLDLPVDLFRERLHCGFEREHGCLDATLSRVYRACGAPDRDTHEVVLYHRANPRHTVSFLAAFAARPRSYGLATSGTTRSRSPAASDVLVRAGWEDRLRRCSFLLEGGSGSYLSRPTLRLCESGEHHEVGVKLRPAGASLAMWANASSAGSLPSQTRTFSARDGSTTSCRSRVSTATDAGEPTLPHASRGDWTNKTIDLKVKSVCQDCNGGWMHRLDLAAEDAFLTHAVIGYPVKLALMEEKITLGRWCSLVATLFDETLNLLTYPQRVHEVLYAGDVPEDMQAWLFRTQPPGGRDLAWGGNRHVTLVVRMRSSGLRRPARPGGSRPSASRNSSCRSSNQPKRPRPRGGSDPADARPSAGRSARHH